MPVASKQKGKLMAATLTQANDRTAYLNSVFLSMVSAMAPAIPGCEELAAHPELVT